MQEWDGMDYDGIMPSEERHKFCRGPRPARTFIWIGERRAFIETFMTLKGDIGICVEMRAETVIATEIPVNYMSSWARV